MSIVVLSSLDLIHQNQPQVNSDKDSCLRTEDRISISNSANAWGTSEYN